jgi:hypothetical protein
MEANRRNMTNLFIYFLILSLKELVSEITIAVVVGIDDNLLNDDFWVYHEEL